MNIIKKGYPCQRIECVCKTVFEFNRNDVIELDDSLVTDILTIVRRKYSVVCPVCGIPHALKSKSNREYIPWDK